MFRLIAIGFCFLAGHMTEGAMYLHLEGIPGESKSSRHAGWIEVQSVSMAVQRAPAATPKFDPLQLTKLVDKASPNLFLHLAQGRTIPNAVLEVYRQNRTTTRLLQFKLTDVIISSFQQSGNTSAEIEEKVEMAYKTINFIYTQQASDLSALRDISVSWDLAANSGSGGTTNPDSDDDGMPDAYERLYGLDLNFADAHEDFDQDGMTNIEEFRAGTLPNRADSIFRVSGVLARDGATSLNWEPAPDKSYRLMGATSPDQPFQFIRFLTEAEAGAGQIRLPASASFQFFILEAE